MTLHSGLWQSVLAEWVVAGERMAARSLSEEFFDILAHASAEVLGRNRKGARAVQLAVRQELAGKTSPQLLPEIPAEAGVLASCCCQARPLRTV